MTKPAALSRSSTVPNSLPIPCAETACIFTIFDFSCVVAVVLQPMSTRPLKAARLANWSNERIKDILFVVHNI